MNQIYIPEGYKPPLGSYETQRAIAYIKKAFQEEFATALNLKRVSAPLFVTADSGLNDNLNGFERPVSFDVPAVGNDAQVVHSLAKWKRLALKRYHFGIGNGLYTDMNAIRRDEDLDNIHSIYVDQWDWEKVITKENRNLEYLKLIVRAIVGAICNTNDRLHVRYPQLRVNLSREVTCLLRDRLYPAFVAVAEAVDANAGAYVDIFFSVLVIGDSALAAFEGDVVPAVGVHYVFRVFFLCVQRDQSLLLYEKI